MSGPAVYEVEGPDGKVYEVEGPPDVGTGASPALVENREGPPIAPTPAAPQQPAPGPGEAVVRGFTDAVYQGAGPEIAAGTQVGLDYLQSGAAKLGLADEPEEHSFEDYVLGYKQRNRQAETANPNTYNAAHVTGDAAVGMLLPEAKAAQGANLAGRALTLGKNVATDAALGAANATARSEAQTSERLLDDAQDGAMWSGGARTGLGVLGEAARGVMSVPGRMSRAAASMRAEGHSPEVASNTRQLLATTPEGAAKRKLALEGEDVIAAAGPKVKGALDKLIRIEDFVLDKGKIAMKRGPVKQSIADLGPMDVDHTSHVLDVARDVRLNIYRALSDPDIGRVQQGGINAKRHASKGLEAAKAKLDRIKQSGPEASAEVYMVLDQMKRDVGIARGKAAAGGDETAAEVLEEQYEVLRQFLEHGPTWGNKASQMQRTVNSAWTEDIPNRNALSAYIMEAGHGQLNPDRGVGAWGKSKGRGHKGLDQADPGKIMNVLENAGSFKTSLASDALGRGVESRAKLVSALASEYDLPAEYIEAAAEGRVAADEVARLFGDSREAREAMEMLASLKAADKSVELPAKVPFFSTTPEGAARSMATSERMMATPRGRQAARSLGTAGRAARTAGRVGGLHMAGEQAYNIEDSVRQAAASGDPSALGGHQATIQDAINNGNFGVVHSMLQQTDLDYQQGLRELEEQEY